MNPQKVANTSGKCYNKSKPVKIKGQIEPVLILIYDKKTVDRVMSYTYMTDRFMTVAFNKEVAGYVLSVIFDKKLQVETLRVQQPAERLIGRGVRFDVFARDLDGKVYNIEVQNADEGASAKRARYNCELADSLLLSKGKDFEALPELYVIFITKNDVLGKGLPIYHINRRIEETGELFGDEEHIIFVNGSNKDKSTALGQLMADMQQSDPSKISSKILADRMTDCKKGEYLNDMCKEIEELRAETLAEGRAEGRISTAISNVVNATKSLGRSVDDIVCILNIDADIRDEVIAKAKASLSNS